MAKKKSSGTSSSQSYYEWYNQCKAAKANLDATAANVESIINELKALNGTSVSSGSIPAFAFSFTTFSGNLNLGLYNTTIDTDTMQEILSFFGRQPSGACAVYSQIYAQSIMYIDYRRNGGTLSLKDWNKTITSNNYFCDNEEDAVRIMYQEVSSGRPVTVMVNGSNRHFVCASGVMDFRPDGTRVTIDNARQSDFLLMEPASPELKPMDTDGFVGIDGAEHTSKRFLATCKQAGNKDFGSSHNGKNQYLIITYGDIDYSGMKGVSLSHWSGNPVTSYSNEGSIKVDGKNYDVSYNISASSFQSFYDDLATPKNTSMLASTTVNNPTLIASNDVGLHPFM